MASYCGIDEAGRGSVMGPLVVGAVKTESDEPLVEMGVRDSKKLTPKRREAIYELITSQTEWTISVISAEDIDLRRKQESLNDIEMSMFVECAEHLGAERLFADCPDVNEQSFGARMTVRLPQYGVIIAKHKADDSYPVVSAASIVAKVNRDRMMDDIRHEFGTDIGSGYPSDRHTMEFIEDWIRENGRAPAHVRCSWEPVRVMLSRRANTKLTDW